MAEFIAIKGYKAKGKRLTNYSVDNIKEIEPVVRKESDPSSAETHDNEQDEEQEQKPAGDTPDPSQMSLFSE